jgi:hypothetical protein
VNSCAGIWRPVCTSGELTDLPKKVKLLCEELVVFRDKKGRLGAADRRSCTRKRRNVRHGHRHVATDVA